MGLFRNLASREITENILREINNHLQARIKCDEERYSEEFEVEESIREGNGLSAILYAQHAVIGDLQKEHGIGTEMGEMQVPAIGWEDDITAIIKDPEEQEKFIEIMTKSEHVNIKNQKNVFADISNMKILIVAIWQHWPVEKKIHIFHVHKIMIKSIKGSQL